MPEAPALPEPQSIPLPPEFPIDWPSPAMALANWRQDRQHVPRPMTPMSAWWSSIFARGFSEGLASTGIPMATMTARFNTYFYLSVGPKLPPEQMAEAEAKAEPMVREAMARFWERWENEWLPELKAWWERWEARDLPSLSDGELKEAVDEMAKWYERCWTIHFEVLPPAMVGTSMFQDLYAEIFPDREPLASYRLSQGAESMSLAAGRALWQISRVAKADEGLCRLVESTPSANLWEALDGTAAGRDLKARLEDYLRFYGRRSDTVQELGDPSWTEDPTPALENLKSYVAKDDDPDTAHARLAADRERYVAEARAAIADRPAEFKGMFEALLAAAQRFASVQEDHNFWIDQRSLHEVRQLCREVGRRLASAGLLESANDVFYLDMDEALAGLAGGDRRELVAQRKAEMEYWSGITPPPVVGTDYGPPPDNPVTRALFRFFGGPPLESKSPGALQGNPGSPGKVSGIARVVIAISDAGRLQPGDILVTATTSPPWTPFFAIVDGIVTDTGGPLSHCAIVAREYGIPAVVGAAGATAFIADGSEIEVDGDTGVVRILGG